MLSQEQQRGQVPAARTDALLRLHGITQIYNEGVRALDDVSLDISPGLFGLLGPNGAGKSTLMRTLATLQTPTAGTIRFDDIDVLAEPERLRRTLGYLPQGFGVYPRVTVEDMLDHMAVLKGVSARRERRDLVGALLHRVNLWGSRRRALASLSGGMRQRFGIAQALIGAPRLIIVDEPTAGLDPEERNRCLDLLADIEGDVVVILSTHIVADVADLCSRAAVLAGGRLLRDGAPLAMLAELEGRVWRKVVARTDLAAARREHTVISTRLVAGQTVVHVLADARPDRDFEPAPVAFDDIYFATLATRRG